MGLSSDLISQFVKITKDEKEPIKESTVYGTTVSYNGTTYVKLDGSEMLTPVETTANIKDGERVIVTIKNHSATVTGNITSPSASSGDVEDLNNEISEFDVIISHRVVADDIEAINARIDSLQALVGTFDNLTADEIKAITAQIESIQSKVVDTDYLNANDIEAINAEIESLRATFGTFGSLTTEDLEAVNAEIDYLKTYSAEFTYVSTDVLTAIKAEIKELDTEKLSVKDAKIKYANIDFANITEAAVEKLFSDSGIIKDLVVSEGHITGELVGVTIKGDLIEAGTVKADKLVVKGSDGLYYKLNIDAGVTSSEEVTKEELQNGLHGDTIIAHTITAEKINVNDLVAFGATIGGFKITTSSLYSGVKNSAVNTTRGVYMDNSGQFSVGDGSNYLRYYQDSEGNYKLEISAKSISLSSSGVNIEDALTDVQKNAITDTTEQFYQSDSPKTLSGGSWNNIQPEWIEGKYIWRRTLVEYGDGHTEYTPSEDGVCITGNTGEKGEDSVFLQILSSNGNLFKNSDLATSLTITIIVSNKTITSSREMYETFGDQAYLEWEEKRFKEDSFTPIDPSDPRLSDNGFILELTPKDVLTQVVFNCRLMY